MKRLLSSLTLTFCFGALLNSIQPVFAQGTAFSYQGQLSSGNSPANGSFDIVTVLYNDPQIGGQQGPAVTNFGVSVTNGLFILTNDFGLAPFTGQPLWLQLLVRTNGVIAFTSLSPRQAIYSVPYAVQALSANTATSANTANVANSANSVAAGNITGALATAQLPASVVTNTAIGVVLNGTFTGNGAGLTGLNPVNLSGGTASINITGNAATATSTVGFSGNLAGDVSGAMNQTSVIQVGGVPAATVGSGSFLAYSLLNAGGFNNVFLGQSAGNQSASTSYNTAIGYRSLFENTDGAQNTATGAASLLYNIAGSFNTADGYEALYLNQSGRFNTAVGTGAIQNGQTGSFNTATGAYALDNNTAFNNTATGFEALYYNATGSNNVAEGAYALYDSDIGTNNVAEGTYALTYGDHNNSTAVGFAALQYNYSGDNNIALGYRAGYGLQAAESNNIDIGNEGISEDNGVIRLGTGGIHNKTIIAGVINGDGGGLFNVDADAVGGNALTVDALGNVDVSTNLNVSGTLSVSNLAAANAPGVNWSQANESDLGVVIPGSPGIQVDSSSNLVSAPGFFVIMATICGDWQGNDVFLALDDTTSRTNQLTVTAGYNVSDFNNLLYFGFSGIEENTIALTWVVPTSVPAGSYQKFATVAWGSSGGATYFSHNLTVMYFPRQNN